MAKKNKSKGQSLLPHIQQSLDDQSKEDSRPSGMPTLASVRTEAMRMGLTEEDTQYVYDIWLQNGFKTRSGVKINDFKAALRVWYRHGFFPSQKEAKRGPKDPHMDRIIRKFKK